MADSRRLLAIVMAPFTAILGLAGRTIGAGDAVWAARRQLGGRLGGRGAPAAISAQITFGQSTPIEFGSGRPSELTWSTGMRASPNGLETPPIDAAGFVGYVQVRCEGGTHRLRVRGMVVDQSFSSGGLSSIPRGVRRAGADGPWTFDLSKVGSGGLPRQR